MADRTYENESIRVHWKPKLCMHSGECVKAQAGVFDPDRRPWVDVDAASAADVAAAVERCPSGALTYELIDDAAGEATTTVAATGGVKVTVMDNGPVLLSGEFTVSAADGTPIETSGGKAALCRCGMSSTKPFCDGTHKREGWTADAE